MPVVSLESIKYHVLLDWIRYLVCKEVVSLCCTSRGLKEVLDANYSVWEHCLAVQPLFVKSYRMVLPRAQRNRHCCIWHLYIWHKIQSASSFTYLLSNIESYSFASGLVCATFRRIQDLSTDEVLRYSAHKLLVHEMLSQHLNSTSFEDIDEVIAALEALKVLGRPFVTITVNPNIFAATSPSITANCILAVIQIHGNNIRVLEAAFNACTNLSLHRHHALYFVAEGFINIFRTILQNNEVRTCRPVLIAGLNSLRNIYDPLHIVTANLEVHFMRNGSELNVLIDVAVTIARAQPEDTFIIEKYTSYLQEISVWQAPHMRSPELSSLLCDLKRSPLSPIARDLHNRIFITH